MCQVTRRRLNRRVNHSIKSVVAIVLTGCVIFLAVWIAGALHRSTFIGRDSSPALRANEKSQARPDISLEDIKRLPADPSYDDVATLLGGYTFADNLMYKCPAREGGVYFFSFFPTREVALPKQNGAPNKLILVAVIQFPSESALLAKDGGVYVYPPRHAGVKFSGFMPGMGW